MKKYSPGASTRGDFAYICDNCEIDDGRPTLLWEPLPGRRGHFCLCYKCLANLNFEYNHAPDPAIEVVRTVIPEQLRNRIYERDNYRCVLCGSSSELQLDHIIPFSKGGRTEEANLRTLCKSCNLRKRDGGGDV